MDNYVDMDGVVNVSIGLVKHAKKDFIRGAKILYGHLKRIPTEDELRNNPTHFSLANDADVRWMYDAWRFVHSDPYEMFDIGEETVINAWKEEAILEHYKTLYLRNGALLYRKHAPKKIHLISDEDLEALFDQKTALNEFLEARNYISKLPNKEELFHEYNIIAIRRSRDMRMIRGRGRQSIENSEYNKMLRETRAKNIKKTQELYDAGMSPKAIAKYLGVTIQSVRSYLRASASS